MNKAVIFCDASFKSKKSGWAAWITCGNEKLIKMGNHQGHYNSNEAEFYGCFKSITAAISNFKNLDEITIISDSICVVDHLKIENRYKECSNPNIQSMKRHLVKLLSHYQIDLKTQHIKGHQQVKCDSSMKNHAVDKLSKAGREQLSA